MAHPHPRAVVINHTNIVIKRSIGVHLSNLLWFSIWFAEACETSGMRGVDVQREKTSKAITDLGRLTGVTRKIFKKDFRPSEGSWSNQQKEVPPVLIPYSFTVKASQPFESIRVTACTCVKHAGQHNLRLRPLLRAIFSTKNSIKVDHGRQ